MGSFPETADTPVALQAHFLGTGRDGEPAAGFQGIMALAALVRLERRVLVGPQQCRLIGRMGIMAGGAVRIGDRQPPVGLGEFRAAGNTGTGELPGKEKKDARYAAGFEGYAPREAPLVAFACCFVDVEGSGGSVSGPVCLEFLKEFMKP